MKNFFLSFKKINIIQRLNLNRFEKPVIYIIAVIAFLIVNILVSSFTIRLDLSQGHAYTLSNASKKIIKNSKDTVTIKLFASSDLPTRLLPLKNDVVDLLNEYKRQSRNVRVQVLDPKKDNDALNQAKNAGIPQLQFSQLEQDQYAVTASYFGILISDGSKTSIIPQVTAVESLEYNLTAAIYKLTQKKLSSIGLLGFDVDLTQPQDPYSLLRTLLDQQFDSKTLTASDSGSLTIDPSIKTILVSGANNRDVTPGEVSAIKSYLHNKGKALFFVDGIPVTDDLQALPPTTSLNTLFADYGIKLNNDLVLSTSSELVNFGTSQSSFLVPYPFWVKTNNVDTSSSYFSNVNQLTYPWPSSISLTKKAGVETKNLVKSMPQSWGQTKNFTLNPQTIAQPNQKDFHQFTLTAESKKNNEGEIFVIASSRFAQDQYISQQSNNLDVVLNVLNDYASAGALSGIRQRAVNFYPLPNLTESQKDTFKYLNILLFPVIFALYGGWRILKRK